MANTCPNKNLADYQKLVDRLGEQGAFYVFIKNGNKVPYLQSGESNRFTWDVENDFKLVSWKKEADGKNIKQYKGFDRFTTEKLIQDIRDKYIGNYTIKRISPDTEGEFGLKVVGMPVLKSEVQTFNPSLSDMEALDNYLYYEEFKMREKEANEDILPIDTYDQKITNLEYLNRNLKVGENFAIESQTSRNGSIRSIEITPINEPENTVGMLTFRDSTTYPGYKSIKIAFVKEDYRGQGLATTLYESLMASLGPEVKGIVSPGESRLNKTQVPYIHTQLEKRFKVERLDNGDILFTKGKDEDVALDKKLQKLQQLLMTNMPFVEEVIYDRTLTVAGRLHAGGKKISVNPDYMTLDTLGHEFGHLLIDLRGGLKDPFIREAIEQLRGSKLWNRTLERYPELEGTEKFEKEVLAEAIGLETVDLFESLEENEKFEKWLLRFFRWLSSRLGISKSNARELARQLLGQSETDYVKLGKEVVDYYQDQKAKIDPNKPETIRDAILELSNGYKLEDEDHYSFKGKLFDRVSRVMGNNGYGIKRGEDDTPALVRGKNIGTTVHANAEGAAKGAKESIKVDTGFELTPNAYKDLQNIVRDKFGKDSIVMSEVVLGDPEAGMAGTIDIIVITKDGKVFLQDYKTKEKYKGFKYYDKPFGNNKSQREVNTMQLSLYKKMLSNIGVKVTDMSIIPLLVETKKITNNGIEKELITSIEAEGNIKLRTHPNTSTIYKRQQEAYNLKESSKVEQGDITEDELAEREDEIRNISLASTIRDKFQLIRDKALGIINSRLRRDKNTGKTANINTLTDLLDTLADEGIEDKIAITSFVDNAIRSIGSIYSDYKNRKERYDNGDTEAFNIRMFERWHDILNAYNILDDVASAIMEGDFNLGGIEEDAIKEMKYQLDEAIKQKNVLKKTYETLGGDMLADILKRYSTRVIVEKREQFKREWLSENKDKYKGKELETEMEKASDLYMSTKIKTITEETRLRLRAEMQRSTTSDISLIERWMGSLKDSNDMLVAAMIKKFVVTDRAARQKAISFRNKLLPALENLEKFYNYTTSTKPEDLYDFMLEKDSKGNLTGHIVTKFRSDLMSEYEEVKRNFQDLPPKERWESLEAWRKKNMPLNEEKRNKEFKEYINSLVVEGILSKDEETLFWANEDLPFRKREYIDKFLNPEAAERITSWKQNNFFNYREPVEKWRNPQWETLESILQNENDPRTIFYNLILDSRKEADANLPFKQRIHTKLPFVIKSTRERILSGQTAKEVIKDRISDITNVRADEDSRGSMITDENDKPIDFLPIHYVNKGQVDIKEQSFDIATIYYKFYKMATNYGEKSEILHEMEYTKTILENREMALLDSKGNPIKQALATLGDRQLTKSGKTSQLLQQYEEFLKALLYGQTKADEGSWDIFGYKIDKAKMLDSFSKYTAYNMLGLNLLQAISNVSMGETTQVIEAIAGEYFNLKDLNDASTTYLKELGDIFNDIGQRAPVSKIGLLNEKFDILNEYEGGTYRKNSKFANMLHESALFFMSHAGEHFMQSRVMMAMLKKVKAYDSAGNELGNMYDMYKPDGYNLVLDERVDLAKSKWLPEHQILFGEKVKTLLSRLHGEYSELGKNAAQRYITGRMGLMFRKFVMPGWNRRWQEKRVNEFLGEYTEGYYRSTFGFISRVIKEMRTLGMSAMTENWNKLLPREKKNIYRAISEVAFSFLFATLAAGLLTLRGEVDDDDKLIGGALSTGVYISSRLRAELRFFLNPLEAMTLLRSPAASISMIESVIKFGGYIIFNPTELYERGNWAGYPKFLKHGVQLMPGVKQYYRTRDVEDLLSLFQ